MDLSLDPCRASLLHEFTSPKTTWCVMYRQEYRPPEHRQEAAGVRPKVRAASAATASAWDKPKPMPRAPPPGTTGHVKVARPKNATAAKPWGRESVGLNTTEFALSGQGLEAQRGACCATPGVPDGRICAHAHTACRS
eukprot:364800-Chlamydomonas_euryale.AAC.9